MRDESLQASRRRERVAPNLYRRRTKDGRERFDAYFRDGDGRLRTVVLKATTQREATRELRALLRIRDQGGRVVGDGLTLGAFAERDYFPLLDSLAAAGRRSERGVDLYRGKWKLVEPVLGDLQLGKVEGRDIAELVRGMRQGGYGEGTIASALVVLRGIYRLARARRLVAYSPVDELDPAERPKPKKGGAGRVLDEGELELLVRQASYGYRPVVTTLAYTGLRISEVLGLRWRDVDFVEGELYVGGQLSLGRGDRPARRVELLKTEASERYVPIFPAVERELARLRNLEEALGRGRDDDLVFLTRRTGQPLSQRNASRAVIDAATAAGLGKAGPHDLRRSFCSLAGRRGVDPIEAAQITGHSPDVWARHYAQSFGKAQRQEARRRMLEHGFGTVEPAAPRFPEPGVPRANGGANETPSNPLAEPRTEETEPA
jgi:integrase